MSEAGDANGSREHHQQNGNGDRAEHDNDQNGRTRLQSILSFILGIEIGEAATVQTDRPPGWYVEVDDWPIGKTEDDLSPEEALDALKGLSRDYYEPAMRSLAHTRQPKELEVKSDHTSNNQS